MFDFNSNYMEFKLPDFSKVFTARLPFSSSLFTFSQPMFGFYDSNLFSRSAYSEDTFYPELSGNLFDSSRFMNFDIPPAYPTFPDFTFPSVSFPSFSTKKAAYYSNLKPSTTTTLADVAKIYNPQKGAKLAQATINGLQSSQTGYCARAVKTGIVNAGLGHYQSGDAKDLPAILGQNRNNFREVSVAGKDLAKLPAGCILCYAPGDSGYNPKYGHTEITDGNGNAISFYVNNNIKPSDKVRVFVPV